jgi:hypothetical protein
MIILSLVIKPTTIYKIFLYVLAKILDTFNLS